MAVAPHEMRQEMGRILVEAVEGEPSVSSLWVSTDHDGVHFWLVTVPIDMNEELRLYELDDLLDEPFPGALFQLHVLNQRHFTGPARDAVPRGAEELPLRAN